MNPQRRRRLAKTTGRNAEENARVYGDTGLQTLACNFRTAKGEIDLVKTDGATTVFVEVCHRSHPGFGGAAASVDRRMRLRLQRAAAVWLGHQPTRTRFDVIATDGDTIHWIRDAFRAETG